MLTRLRIKNFKRFEEADIPLGNAVVFIGPNNSGKTTALQALTLWDIGIKAWSLKREGKSSPEKRPGVTINRRDLINIPVPASSLLWKGLHVRRKKSLGEGTENIRIDVIVFGVTNDIAWDCGLEFDFSNEESFICRPLRLPEYKNVPVNQAKFSTIPKEATAVKVGYLPPMSGLSAEEALLQPGRINVLLGQGQTAQVLRNLCYQIYENKESEQAWTEMTTWIYSLFGIKLFPPKFIVERGEITMEYEERGARLDLSSSGRGVQQTLLLLAHLYANPNTVLLLDEPDAHLEILRQRETFRVINEVAGKQGSQIIAASHSEVVLGEAATRGNVIAFIGKPHLINDRKSQLLKSLTDIGWDQYYQAEQTGWVLYLESASDLEILRSFAEILKLERAVKALSRPFVHYVSNNLPQRCRDHFYGLQEAKPDLIGVALFDRLDKDLKTDTPLYEMMWQRREIENYFCTEEVLSAYARSGQPDDLFGRAEADRKEKIMRRAIEEVVRALETLDKPDSKPWSADIKASDDFLNPIFKKYFSKLGLPLLLRKTDYHLLVRLISKDKIDAEVVEKLDLIASVAKKTEKKEKL
jgi:energy-coupling factor transporter ATP-binding protein EcfA2